MPDLRSDFVGRVNRLPLKPSDRTALVPILEAVSNSVYAITERFDENAVKTGKVIVSVLRDLEKDDEPIIGFDVEDNGIGFTTENYDAFLTPDTRLKEKRGGKGVGRLAWLKVFDYVDVESVFDEAGTRFRRKFRFQLTEKDQVQDRGLERIATPTDIGTRVSFRGFHHRFADRCPSKPGTIALRVLSHFVPLFIGGNAPKVIINDGEAVDIEALFADSIVDERTDKVVVDLGTDDKHEFEIWSLKCDKRVRFDGGGYNFAFLTANKRSVIDYSIDDQIGLRALDGEYIYLASAAAEFLDAHVNSERTGFTFDSGDVDTIKRAVAKEARGFLRPYVERALAQKVSVTKDVIAENPQFLYVEPDVKGFAEALQPNLYKKEDIFVELSRNRFRRQRTFAALEKDIVKSPIIDDALREKVDEYAKFVTAEKRGALAEYVTRRRAVIDLFEKFLEYRDAEKQNYEREEIIHQLVCPMRITSHSLEIEDHNLWLLDDRLAFYHYFASDKAIQSYTAVEDRDRPDLAFFYDTCVAWREGENSDTVVLVEFKKPMRDDYTSGPDPVQQILRYVKTLRSESAVPDTKGRAIRGINAGTAFHCYVVADLTPTFEASIIGRFNRTPDNYGYFGYSQEPPAFVEIVPYGKILRDAKMRNAIFFQTLGITTAG